MRIAIIGDLHGQLGQAKALWSFIQKHVGPDSFSAIFLGDYVDRGPDSKGLIDWLVALRKQTKSQSPARVGKPQQQGRCSDITFLAGNHDVAMGLFLGLYPMAPSQAAKTWQGDKQLNFPAYVPQRKEGSLWSGEGSESLHLQGLRWGGSAEDPERNPFQSGPTFASYGVRQGDRASLLDALPPAHAGFLRSLQPWRAVALSRDFRPYRRLLAVHAGLEVPGASSLLREVPDVERQLGELRDWSALEMPWVEQLQGRGNTRAAPEGLREAGTLVVSGHHGTLDLQDDWRWIVDGGSRGAPIAAVLLPDQLVLRSDGTASYRTRRSPSAHKPLPA